MLNSAQNHPKRSQKSRNRLTRPGEKPARHVSCCVSCCAVLTFPSTSSTKAAERGIERIPRENNLTTDASSCATLETLLRAHHLYNEHLGEKDLASGLLLSEDGAFQHKFIRLALRALHKADYVREQHLDQVCETSPLGIRGRSHRSPGSH